MLQYSNCVVDSDSSQGYNSSILTNNIFLLLFRTTLCMTTLPMIAIVIIVVEVVYSGVSLEFS